MPIQFIFVKSTYSKLMKIVETKELNVLNRFIMVLIQKNEFER